MSTLAELEHRVEDLESRLAFMDEAQTTLSDTLVRVTGEVAELQQRLDSLLARLRDTTAPLDGVPPDNEGPPPHY